MFKLKAKHIIFLLLYAFSNTLLSFSIIYIINQALAGDPGFLKDYMAIIFIAYIAYTYFLNIIFQKELNIFSFKWLYDFEKKIFGQFLKAPLEKFEEFGSQRFFTTVEDLRIFSWLPSMVTHTVNSLLMLLLCLVYMFFLSVQGALLVVVLIVAVAACYFVVMNSMSRQVSSLRVLNEHYFGFVDDVINGFKKLKLSFFRREKLMTSFLIPNRDEAKDLDTNINYVFLSINLINQYGLYFVIGVILFVLPVTGLLAREEVIAYVIILLFMAGPINTLINFQQSYTRLMVANRRIKEFISDFDGVNDEENAPPSDPEVFKSGVGVGKVIWGWGGEVDQ
ncbi:MAG: cyclic peptide export ABC transporter, partial [Bacteroidota bacterium]